MNVCADIQKVDEHGDLKTTPLEGELVNIQMKSDPLSLLSSVLVLCLNLDRTYTFRCRRKSQRVSKPSWAFLSMATPFTPTGVVLDSAAHLGHERDDNAKPMSARNAS
jgi:hypothetical protein